MIKLFFTIVICLFIYCSDMATADCYFNQTTNLATTEKQQKKFYDLVESIVNNSSSSQISKLKEFLLENAEFEPVYLKLLERYIICDQLSEATEYLQILSAQSRYRRNSQWMLARVFAFQNDSLAALKFYKQALKSDSISIPLLKDFIEFIYPQTGKFASLSELRALNLNQQYQHLAEAIINFMNEDFKKAMQEFKKVSSHYLLNTSILDIRGNCYYRISQYHQADSLWRIGLLISRQKYDLVSEAMFLAYLGDIAWRVHDYEKSANYYYSANKIAKRIDDFNLIQDSEAKLGNISYFKGDYSQALIHYKKAIEIALKIRAERSLIDSYFNYAQVLFEKGNLIEAFQVIDSSEAIAQKINDRKKLINAMIRKGTYYAYLHQFAFARTILKAAYDSAGELNLIDHQYRAQVKLAILSEEERKYSTAREAYHKFINHLKNKGDRLEQAYWLGKIAYTYLLENHYHWAKKYYLKAFETAKMAHSKAYTGWYLIKVADLEVIEGKAQAATQKYTAALEIAKAENNTNMLWQVFLGFGSAFDKAGDLSAAISAYRCAASVIEESRKTLSVGQLRIGYFSERNKVYQKLVRCFLERYEKNGTQADLDSLYYFDQMRRGRTLQELRFRKEQSADDRPTTNQCEQYTQACRQLRQIQRQLRQQADKICSDTEWDNLFSRLETAQYYLIAQRLRLGEDDIPSDRCRQTVVPSLAIVMKNLNTANFALLLYHISEETSFVLAAAGDTAKIVRLQTNPTSLALSIDSLITPFHKVGEDSIQYTPFKAAIAHRLYNKLIKPVEDMLTLPPQLLIVPDLALMGLPFEMLLDEIPDKPDYTPADAPAYADHFLLHRYTFAYAPSPGLLPQKSKSIAANPKVLAVANPFTESQGPNLRQNRLRSRAGWCFDPLPFSEVEVERIKQVHSSTEIYKRGRALKHTLIQMASQQQLLHIATHAFINTTFDAFSGLVLATSRDSLDDGLLMGYEISELNLNKCDLITLSACETGCGELVAGEGVLGLSRLFLCSGARSVLMTLWKVDDKFTSELMPRFYQYLFKQNLSKVEALNKAKRLMLENIDSKHENCYQHPFYWASFVLYGDPGKNQNFFEGPTKSIVVVTLILMFISPILYYSQYLRRHKDH